MYIVHSTFVVPEEKSDEVVGSYWNRSRLVDRADGFKKLLLLKAEQAGGESE